MGLPGCAPDPKPPKLTDIDRPHAAPVLCAGRIFEGQAALSSLAILDKSTHTSMRKGVEEYNESDPCGVSAAPVGGSWYAWWSSCPRVIILSLRAACGRI